MMELCRKTCLVLFAKCVQYKVHCFEVRPLRFRIRCFCPWLLSISSVTVDEFAFCSARSDWLCEAVSKSGNALTYICILLRKICGLGSSSCFSRMPQLKVLNWVAEWNVTKESCRLNVLDPNREIRMNVLIYWVEYAYCSMLVYETLWISFTSISKSIFKCIALTPCLHDPRENICNMIFWTTSYTFVINW